MEPNHPEYSALIPALAERVIRKYPGDPDIASLSEIAFATVYVKSDLENVVRNMTGNQLIDPFYRKMIIAVCGRCLGALQAATEATPAEPESVNSE